MTVPDQLCCLLASTLVTCSRCFVLCYCWVPLYAEPQAVYPSCSNKTKALIHVSWERRLGIMRRRCLPLASSCVCHQGFVFSSYITGPCVQEPPRACSGRPSVTRITASYPSTPSKQSHKQHMERQLWSLLTFITVAHDAFQLTRSLSHTHTLCLLQNNSLSKVSIKNCTTSTSSFFIVLL